MPEELRHDLLPRTKSPIARLAARLYRGGCCCARSARKDRVQYSGEQCDFECITARDSVSRNLNDLRDRRRSMGAGCGPVQLWRTARATRSPTSVVE